MKKTTGNKIRLGIFVSISILLFILGIYFIGQRQQLFSNTFHVSGIFRDISGLQVGNNVRFSGINVGIIDEIEQITDSTVSVGMVIDEATRKFIKKNAKAIIGSDGLMGNKIILIIPGTSSTEQIDDNDVIATAMPVSMDDILIKLKVTSDNAALITTDLAAISKNIHEGKGTVGRLLMDSIMAQNVAQALTHINQGAGGFKQNMDAASHNFLLKGYLKKKEKAKKEKAEDIKEKADDLKQDQKEKKEDQAKEAEKAAALNKE
jgi:phospholipid/cholesterol/gamma-HCH transport system substrate-binding protein